MRPVARIGWTRSLAQRSALFAKTALMPLKGRQRSGVGAEYRHRYVDHRCYVVVKAHRAESLVRNQGAGDPLIIGANFVARPRVAQLSARARQLTRQATEREVAMKQSIGRWTIHRRPRVLHNRVLDSEGWYREVARSGRTVELEVVSAPGLTPGTHMHVTAAAARMMTSEPSRAGVIASHAAHLAARLVVGHTPRVKLPTA
jgi:hypothetical protein